MRRISTAVILIAALLVSGGCAGSGSQGVRPTVIPLPNRGAAILTSDDVARVLTRAGLGDEQILEIGTDFRNAIAVHGSARIHVGQKTEVIAAVVDGHLHVSSRTGGSFVYAPEDPLGETGR